MDERTTERAPAPGRESDTAVRLSQTEALLAVLVDHLDREVGTLRFALGVVLTELGASSRPKDDPVAIAQNMLYPETLVTEGVQHRQAPAAPFPVYWLRQMAVTGRSLAQVAGKHDAAQRVARALSK